tara:strand:+ start:169 stop:657 length:489 start_codon:yes stop_codon:yes gene_type:complete
MVIKHSTVATATDEAGAEVNKAEWNDDHVIDDSTLSIAKTSGLQAALDAKATVTQLNTKQATITDGDLTIARTTGLQAAIDAKQATITDGDLTIARTNGLQAAIDGAGGGAHTTQDWTVQSSSPADPSAGTGVMYVKTIDTNNQGLFIKMKKNGSIVEVQVG